MTSEKYFSKWVREAGRGHIAALLSWGSLLAYGAVIAARLGLGSDYTFFGIGSRELVWICTGLGAALSFLEFFYLLQPKKLDFYYSLPVRKSTVFWDRYVHGLAHFMIPLCLVITACGLYESSFDMDFLPYSASYTGHSILVYAAVFLIFYHAGILLVTVCGSMLPAILGYAACLFYGHFLVGNAWTAWAENNFRTYYRIPVFEKLDVMLAPFSLARDLAGGSLFDKLEVFAYVPSWGSSLAAAEWILLPFLLSAAAQKRRKTERVGKPFAIPLAERAAEVLLSFLAGVWCGSFLAGLAPKSAWACGAVSIPAGIAAAAGVHILLELGMGCGIKMRPGKARLDHTCDQDLIGCGINTRSGKASANAASEDTMDPPRQAEGTVRLGYKGSMRRGIFRRKWQLAAECAAVVLSGMVFLLGASPFDSFLPKEGAVEGIGVSIDGIGMDQESYAKINETGSRYSTDWQLEDYILAGEGKNAAAAWIRLLAGRNSTAESETDAVTHAAVCYHMKNGSEIYRLYPVSEEELQTFAMVYETDEYKNIAYPVADSRSAGDARFSWSDGVAETVMKLEESEKEALLDACQKDIRDMKMADLKERLPLGFVKIVSEMPMVSGTVPVYPFFTRTCSLLESYGAQVNRTLADYPVRSVSVGTRNENGRGKRASEYIEDPGEVGKWKKRAVPEAFDLQPLFCPLDYSKEIRAEVTDETTNSIIHVNCYSRKE